MNDLLLDLRFGLRSLLKSPGTTCAALVTLALGIGATTAVYGILNHVILHPLPFKGEDRLVLLLQSDPAVGMQMVPNAEVLERLRKAARNFDAVEPVGFRNLQASAPDPSILKTGFITPTLLTTLGLTPALGRGFLSSEATPGGPAAIMLGFGYWQRAFGGRTDVLGRPLTLNDTAYTIVGVAPRSLDLLIGYATYDLWAPYQFGPSGFMNGRAVSNLGLARLRQGRTLEQGRQEFEAVYHDWTNGNTTLSRWRAEVIKPKGVGSTRTGLLTLFGGVGLVLLIACANVAGLLLVRGAAREQEFAVRTTIGGTRSRLVRQLLAEYALLGALGGALALPVAEWVLQGVRAWHPGHVAALDLVSLDVPTLLFALVVALFTTLLFGILPALRATDLNLSDALKGRSATAGASRGRAQYGLVTAEVALAVVVVVAAGLLIRSYQGLLRTDPGFKTAGLVGAFLNLPENRYPSGPSRADFWRQLVERVGTLPGVRAVTTAGYLPPDFGQMVGFHLEVTGHELSDAVSHTPFTLNDESARYFQVLGIPIVEGRTFTPQDERAEPQVVMLNQAMAKGLWPGASAVGQRLRYGTQDGWLTVVGVFGDIAERGLTGGKDRDWMMFEPARPAEGARWTWIVARAKDDERGERSRPPFRPWFTRWIGKSLSRRLGRQRGSCGERWSSPGSPWCCSARLGCSPCCSPRWACTGS
jgi:putative ABC transport system permease protein